MHMQLSQQSRAKPQIYHFDTEIILEKSTSIRPRPPSPPRLVIWLSCNFGKKGEERGCDAE